MTKPVADKAEIALEYPDKLYIGTFERDVMHRDQLTKAVAELHAALVKA